MSGALSAGINALIHGASVSPFPSMQDMLAPQYLNLKREAEERNALLNQQDLDLKRLEYGLKLQDAAASRALSDSLLAGLNGRDGTTKTPGAYANTPGFGGGGPGASIEVPKEYLPYYEEASKRTGIPTSILIAQHRQESGFNPGATGSAGEIGIGQIKPSTARDPGYGLTGIQNPDTLRDPRTNINFSADYLRARAGNIDWNDPAQVAEGLRRYNGGGDPNYASNVMRYVTPSGQTTVVAANTPPPGAQPPAGATTDLVGPRPLPPVGYNRGEVVRPDTLANTPVQVPVNGLLQPQPQQRGVAARTGGVDTAGPGAPTNTAPATQPATAPAAQQPPPAAPPPAAASTYPVPPPAKPPEMGPLGLTHEQVQRYRPLLEAGGKGSAQVAQHMMETAEKNRTEQRQYQQDLAKWQNDRETWLRNQAADTRAASADKRAEAAEARAAAEAQRKEADAAAAAKRPFQGQSETAQNRNILITGDPKSPEFHAAYAAEAAPKVGEGGLVIRPNMQPYRMPQDADGNPITTYDQPNISIGPGNLGELRKMETQASSLTAALDDFARTAKNASFGEKAATLAGQSTDLRSAWTNAGLMAKGEALFNLGVLSGPDMQVIRGALADPSTFWGAATSSDTIDKQVGRIKRLLETRIDQARRSYGGGMGAGGNASSQTQQQPSAERPPLSSFEKK